MDNGPSDAKRARMDSGPWSNGRSQEAYRALPLPSPYPPQQQTYSRPPSQGPPHHPDDRRHHESDYPVSVQDSHRPYPGAPPTYTTPFSGPNGPREPAMKRDPSAEPLHMHAVRPHSTGDITIDNHVRPPHLEDPRRQSMGYDGLNGPPPNQYRPGPPYPPPLQTPATPMYDRQVYEPPPTPGGQREALYSAHSYTGSSSASNRKKAPRTSQACGQCRTAKGKCDDPKPCSSCREKGLQCDWHPPEPKQGDKVQAEILNLLGSIQKSQVDEAKQQQKQAAKLAAEVERIQKFLFKNAPDFAIGVKSEDGEDEDMKDIDSDSTRPLPAPRRSSTPEAPADISGLEYQSHGDTDEEVPGNPIVPNKPTIAPGHTTGATHMLDWPSVKAIVGELLQRDKIHLDYNYSRELKHSIRVYGRGPGPMSTPSPDAIGDDSYSDLSPSPSAENATYGHLGGGTPPATIHLYRKEADRQGGMGNDGLELDPVTVERLIESYLKNIHIMHPILDPQQIRKSSKAILKSSSPEAAPTAPKRAPPPGFVKDRDAEPPAKKQKQSPHPHSESSESSYTSFKSGQLQRSIGTAVLLLVLALGKLSEHKTKLPDVLPDHDSVSSDSPMIRNGHLSPVQASPTISSNSSGLPSPQEGDRSRQVNRRSSVDGLSSNPVRYTPPMGRNLDIIPGLAYFAKASDIIGNEIGEHTLAHVHANTLAGIFWGQIGRPFKSHGYISVASNSIQAILRPKGEKLQQIKDTFSNVSASYNPLVFAFWTVLQLESDIAAEFNLTHSGITTFEESIPWPNLPLAKEMGLVNEIQAQSYGAQLYLRKHLNTVHTEVYGPEKDKAWKLSSQRFPVIEDMISKIPSVVTIAPMMVWDEDEDPASDILSARLRAKFYGLQVITYRPFLAMVLNRTSRFPDPNDHIPTPVLDEQTVDKENISDNTWNYTRACILALINSTRAFYGLPKGERLVVTNIYGTAHAQWGNVMVLQAAYNDPLLRRFIDVGELRKLVRKTLKFLKNTADSGSSLLKDIVILEFASRKLGLLESKPERDANTHSSFSSTTTAPVDGTPHPH